MQAFSFHYTWFDSFDYTVCMLTRTKLLLIVMILSYTGSSESNFKISWQSKSWGSQVEFFIKWKGLSSLFCVMSTSTCFLYLYAIYWFQNSKSLTSYFFQETEDFFNQFDVICGSGYCEFMLKKLDKKRERQVLGITCGP